MAKSLYSALFDWIVFRTNHALLNNRDLEDNSKVREKNTVLYPNGMEALYKRHHSVASQHCWVLPTVPHQRDLCLSRTSHPPVQAFSALVQSVMVVIVSRPGGHSNSFQISEINCDFQRRGAANLLQQVMLSSSQVLLWGFYLVNSGRFS